MPIQGKRNIGGATRPSAGLSKEESLFIASKLQQASYKGVEFETYQKIMIKLKTIIDNT